MAARPEQSLLEIREVSAHWHVVDPGRQARPGERHLRKRGLDLEDYKSELGELAEAVQATTEAYEEELEDDGEDAE